MALGAYVEEAFTTSVTLNTVLLMKRLTEKFPSVHVPLAAVMQVNVPLWLVNVPLTVAPATACPLESRTVAVTFGCQFQRDEEAMVALSKSPT